MLMTSAMMMKSICVRLSISVDALPSWPTRLRASPAPLPRTMIRENGKIKVMIMYSSEIQVQRTVGCFVTLGTCHF